jgi:hypothetical protein
MWDSTLTSSMEGSDFASTTRMAERFQETQIPVTNTAVASLEVPVVTDYPLSRTNNGGS